MTPDLERFVGRLAAVAPPDNCRNLYAGDDRCAQVRRANLRRYLEAMANRRPGMLLVGEAPGYRGCALTGIPFTSEQILFAASPGSAAATFFGPSGAGYRRQGADRPPRREATATMVWAALHGAGALPLLWNASPFHPHQPGRIDSNRPPRAAELALGRPFLFDLLAVYPIRRVVAVGARAARACRTLPVAVTAVRHPSHGGRAAFVAGWREAVGICGTITASNR